jgi:1-acyl-sn-glycerol-3-phosphate acyltransferase
MATNKISMGRQTPLIIRFGLWIAIWFHVLSGVAILLVVFPFANTKKKHFHIQKWSVYLLKIFGIELVVNNPNILPSQSYLLASNHISWMDIHVINAFKPIRFVAKSEVERWPIFGWMAKQLDTVFIKRDSSRHAHLVVGEMSKVLQLESVCIFPEGTSTNGESVRPFKSNLFEAAVISGVPVYTLAIRYVSKTTGHRSDVPAFVGDMGLLESMAKILKNRSLIAELCLFPPSTSTLEEHVDRKYLAQYSHDEISRYLNSSNSL